MKRNEFLSQVHRAYRPRSYLEIGVATGASLALSRTRTIAVDPAFKITSEIRCDVQLVKATSDDFFAREDGLAHFPDGRIDLAFVDGLHLFESALRDFVNVERRAGWTSVIVVDDVLPRNVAEASRDRGAMVAWTGDVFKLTDALARYRPDLLLLPLDALPAGLLLVLGADPKNRVLEERYDEIVAEYVQPDPQAVPEAVLRRETAFDAASIAASSVWTTLHDAREAGVPREVGWEDVRGAVAAAARPATPRQPTAVPIPGKVAERKLAGIRRRLRPLRRRLREAKAQATRLR